MTATLITIIYLLLVPAMAHWMTRHARFARMLGPVVFAYLLGILLPRLMTPDPAATHWIRDLSIPLAIPLLLFGLDVRGWLRDARAAAFSFLLSVIALLLVVPFSFWLYAAHLPHAAEIGGMLTGMFTGGAPNAAVVHRALDAPPDLFIKVNAVDVLVGGGWFLFLISLAGPLYARLLPAYPNAPEAAAPVTRTTDASLAGLALAFGVDAGIVAVSAGFALLVTGSLAVAPIMLGLTTLAIAASFWPRVHRVERSYPAGYYLVLVFCAAIGSMVDLGQLVAGTGWIAAMLATVFFGTIALHLLLAKLCGLDRDTVIITSTAAIYGPPFVPPVANALGNRAMLLSGLTTGLVGYALGNYLGIGMGLLLGAQPAP